MAMDVLIRSVDHIQISAVNFIGTDTLYHSCQTPMEAFCGHMFEPSIFVGIWDVIPYNLVGGNEGFGGICCICFQVTRAKSYCSRNTLGQFVIV
jgi:hypothetical protein